MGLPSPGPNRHPNPPHLPVRWRAQPLTPSVTPSRLLPASITRLPPPLPLLPCGVAVLLAPRKPLARHLREPRFLIACCPCSLPLFHLAPPTGILRPPSPPKPPPLPSSPSICAGAIALSSAAGPTTTAVTTSAAAGAVTTRAASRREVAPASTDGASCCCGGGCSRERFSFPAAHVRSCTSSARGGAAIADVAAAPRGIGDDKGGFSHAEVALDQWCV